MKSLMTLALLAFSAQSFAWGLESHYGKLSVVKGNYACTLTNKTASDLDIKRVEFNLSRLTGESPEFIVTTSVNSVIYVGETMTVVSDANQVYSGNYCRFLARR